MVEEIRDYYFQGDTLLGPKLIRFFESIGVKNPTKVDGILRNNLYYITGTRVCRLNTEKKETPYCQHIVSTKKELTLNNYQEFMNNFRNCDLKPSTGTEFLNQIKRMYNQGLTYQHIASNLDVSEATICAKVKYLISKGYLIERPRLKRQKLVKVVQEEAQQQIITVGADIRLKVASDILVALLNKPENNNAPFDELIERTIYVTDKLIIKLNR